MVSSLTRNQVRRKPLWVRLPCPPLRIVSHVFAQARNSQRVRACAISWWRVFFVAPRRIVRHQIAP